MRLDTDKFAHLHRRASRIQIAIQRMYLLPTKGPLMGFSSGTCEEARRNALRGAGSVADNTFEEVNAEIQENGKCLLQNYRYGGHGSVSRQ